MGASHIIAETERLTIRWLNEADVPAVAAIWTDEQVTRFMGGSRNFETVCASLREDLEAAPSQLDLWAVAEKDSGLVVGHCGLLPKNVDGHDEIELTYVIAANFWGRGYATEAATAIRNYGFHKLAIARMVALIDPDNAASERVVLKLGMKFEADTIRPSGKTMKVYAVVINAGRHSIPHRG